MSGRTTYRTGEVQRSLLDDLPALGAWIATVLEPDIDLAHIARVNLALGPLIDKDWISWTVTVQRPQVIFDATPRR